MPSPLDALRYLQLQGSSIPAPQSVDPRGMKANAPTDLYGFQNSLRDETQDRFRAAQRAGAPANELQGLGGILSDQEDDINQSPITQQQGEYDSRMKAIQAALAQGFGGTNPTAEMGEYNRGMEARKINAPIEQQRVAGNLDVEKQRIASQGLKDVAEINSQADYNALQKLLALQGGNGLAPGSRVSVSGVGSIATPTAKRPTVSPSTLKSLQDAHAQWKQAQTNDQNNWMPDFMQRNQAPARKAAYDSALGAVFGSFDAHPEIKKLAGMVVSDPELSSLPLQMILSNPKVNAEFDLDGLDENDIRQLTDLLYFVRGVEQ